MSEKVLKVVPAAEPEDKLEAKQRPAEAPAAEAPKETPRPRDGRKRLRMVLLIVLPLIALLGGTVFYLMGGRYISTDNAYVGAQKVLITPDVSGKIVHVAVREGQHVNPGDELFTLDPEPFRLTLQQAQAKLDTARTDYNKAKSSLKSLIERRADPNDRRANRLYLAPAARPLLAQLTDLGHDMMEHVLAGIDGKSNERLLRDLGAMKDNLRAAINRNANNQAAAAQAANA